MLTKSVARRNEQGVVITEIVKLSPQEEADLRAEWAANEAKAEIDRLEKAKEEQKEKLRKEKLDSMLSVEFAEIEAATTEADIEKIKLK